LSKLSEIIEKEIADGGIISFARFMELALYCPEYGFYEKEGDNLGAGGHFYTSVSVGPLFGELLAIQFAEWCEQHFVSNPPSSVSCQLVEAGAHDGRLACDTLTWIATHRSDLLAQLEYCIIEPSSRRRQWQKTTLEKFKEHIHWLRDFSCLRGRTPGEPTPYRIIFCNELLDAMPVHRLCWDATAKRWFELGVTLRAGKFDWLPLHEAPTQDFGFETLDSGVLAVLPDGFILDVCPAAELWWRDAAHSLVRGKLLTFDYGVTSEELLKPERQEGTLRGYYQHRMISDILANPGEQDLTAHVNFSSLQAAGEAAGLSTERFITQERFLTEIVARASERQPPPISWTPSRKRQFQTLTHPDMMGRRFRVLVQSR
jgi:SAM-dependent MidA family methyltransferase